MSVGIDKLASELQKVIEEKDKNKKTPYDTEAEVVRVDTKVVWVKIPGGVDETPVQKTVNAKVGDTVQVRVSGGRAFLVGNGTNPPTDDTVANVAMDNARDANQNAAAAGMAAEQAIESANTANEKAYEASVAAAQAQTDAGTAHTAANEAKADAQAANTAATQAKADAARANTAANEAKADAQAANTAATEAKADAARANTAANEAKADAAAANTAATQAKADAAAASTAAGEANTAATQAKADAQAANTVATQAKADAAAASTAAGKAKTAANEAKADAAAANTAATEAKADAARANTAANASLTQLGIVEDVIGTLTWLSEHAEFSLTEDTEVDTSKQYYEALWGYFPTEDTEIDQSKTYYVRSGKGTDEDPYVYTVVSSPSVEHLSEYYEYKFTGYEPILLSEDDSPTGYYEIASIDEAVTNFIGTHLALTEQGLWVTADADNDYKVLVASDGVYIYGPSGQISKFGEDIEFSSLRPQHIGGDDTYIEFNPSTNKLNIVADDIVIGGKNTLERIETFENTVPAIQDALTSQAQSIHTQQESLDILTGYVDISPTQSRIRVGDKTSTSYVEISGKSDDLRVSINIDGKDVAYMAHNRFYAPSAVVSNLYMQTELSGDNPIGAIGWVMRSNGHLSLKRIK